MAEIIPFRAWRYAPQLTDQIQHLTSPLFDVVSEKYRQLLYQNPLNSIHLSVPLSENVGESAKNAFERWKKEGVILQDDTPAIYAYYQYFNLHNSEKTYCRKGFIAFIKAYDWSENVVLRHENTIPAAVNDRIEILKTSKLNVSPTHGLYEDTAFELEKYMDEAMQNPMYETEDYQGVVDKLACITEPEIIQKFVRKIANEQIVLADGHHRYEGSLAYRKAQKEANPHHTGKEGYNYHLMYLTNSCADDLRILPTHRLMVDMPAFSEAELLEKVAEFFTIKKVADPSDVNDIITGKKWAFGLVLPENTYKIRLKPEVLDSMSWNFPPQIQALDPTVLHYFFIEKVMGILGKDQRRSSNIQFERNFTDCITRVLTGKANLALIMNEISMQTVQQVCKSGYTMPQKSTYFYPKAICGFLFGEIEG